MVGYRGAKGVIRLSQSCMSSRLSLWFDVCGNE